MTVYRQISVQTVRNELNTAHACDLEWFSNEEDNEVSLQVSYTLGDHTSKYVIKSESVQTETSSTN